MGRTAVITAEVAWLAAIPVVHPTWREFALGMGITAVAAYLPDLDHAGSTAGRKVGKVVSRVIRKSTGGHRGGMHSLLAVALAFFAARWFFESDVPAYAFAIGWASHIFTDFLTNMGISLLWPLRRRKYRMPLINVTTGGPGEVVYLVGILVVGFLLLFNYGTAALHTIGKA